MRTIATPDEPELFRSYTLWRRRNILALIPVVGGSTNESLETVDNEYLAVFANDDFIACTDPSIMFENQLSSKVEKEFK